MHIYLEDCRTFSAFVDQKILVESFSKPEILICIIETYIWGIITSVDNVWTNLIPLKSKQINTFFLQHFFEESHFLLLTTAQRPDQIQ